MEVKIATNVMRLSHSTIVTQSPSSVSPRLKKRSPSEQIIVCQYMQGADRSCLFGTSSSSGLYRSRSCDSLDIRDQRHTRVFSATFDAADEFAKSIRELALKTQFHRGCDDDENNREAIDWESESDADDKLIEDRDEFNKKLLKRSSEMNFLKNRKRFSTTTNHREPPPWIEIYKNPPIWSDESIEKSIERKANSADQLSLRIIKRKKQMEVDFREAGDTAYSSIKKAFSSMVSMIRELHIYMMHMREILYFEDLHVIVARVQRDMHVSFVWIFQKIFSNTPMLMVSVMIPLANFTVHSMSTHDAFPTGTCATSTTQPKEQNPDNSHSSIKTFTISSSWSSSSEKLASAGGGNGDDGNSPPMACGSDDGEGKYESVDRNHWEMITDGISQVSSWVREDSVEEEDELNLWNSMGDEALERNRHGLDEETMKELVSPVFAKIESDNNYPNYFKTDLLYQSALAQDPNNPLLLANFAQFLSSVSHDHHRAEEYFKRAVEAEPRDAEALSKYASFLWGVKKDLWAAEETYLEAISVDPTNSFHAANYAHFLWNTGGEDTCHPLGSPQCT